MTVAVRNAFGYCGRDGYLPGRRFYLAIFDRHQFGALEERIGG